METTNKKHNCENCIHKVVCALWETQVGLNDGDCGYYQSVESQTAEIEKELTHVKAELNAAMKNLQKWSVCATCKHYKPHSKKSHCEIKEAYLPGGNWAGCSKWEWRGTQKED